MKIAIKRKDGGVSVMTLIEQEKDGEKFFPDPETEVARWDTSYDPVKDEEYRRNDVVSWREISDEDIPSDRSFREAWTDEFDTETIDVSMPKARDIHMSRIRKVRNEKLAALDVETLKGNDVRMEKQILRDIPQNFDLTKAKTPEELKTLFPPELERRNFDR